MYGETNTSIYTCLIHYKTFPSKIPVFSITNTSTLSRSNVSFCPPSVTTSDNQRFFFSLTLSDLQVYEFEPEQVGNWNNFE